MVRWDEVESLRGTKEVLLIELVKKPGGDTSTPAIHAGDQYPNQNIDYREFSDRMIQKKNKIDSKTTPFPPYLHCFAFLLLIQ